MDALVLESIAIDNILTDQSLSPLTSKNIRKEIHLNNILNNLGKVSLQHTHRLVGLANKISI